jgi:hypothetical protein
MLILYSCISITSIPTLELYDHLLISHSPTLNPSHLILHDRPALTLAPTNQTKNYLPVFELS